MRLILLGSPGVGKGTQAKALAKSLNLVHICSGNLLRQALNEKLPLGQEAKGFMEKGELVPDGLVNRLVLERIRQEDAKSGFILDGYPRNLEQAIALDKALQDEARLIDQVINLQASTEIIIQRLTGRRICSNCQANFHIKNMPSKIEGICDYCQGKLLQRSDDNENTITNRLKVYLEDSAPLIEFYAHQNKLLHFDANLEANTVFKKILVELNGYLKKCPRD